MTNRLRVNVAHPGTSSERSGAHCCCRRWRLKRWSAALCALLLLFAPAFNRDARAVERGELDVLLDRIEARYGQMHGLAADFEQRYTGTDGRLKRERGRLFLRRPRRMRWEYQTQPKKLFIVNNREVWFYVPADREATRADAASVSDARLPFLFLLGQKNLRREFGRIEFAKADAGASSSVRTLHLVPRRRAADASEIYLEVFTDGRINRVTMIDETGAASEVWLTNVSENYIAPDAAFEFRPPPGVNVRKR